MQPKYTPPCASNVRPYVMIETVESEKQEENWFSTCPRYLDVVHVSGCFVITRLIATD